KPWAQIVDTVMGWQCFLSLPLVVSSRALALLSNNWANGMGIVNCIDTYDRSREGSVGTRAAWLTFAEIRSGRSLAPRYADINFVRKTHSFSVGL
ncbi:MAG TPA: hypothetical protein VK589_28920, partial [Chryseolinea sp.]|nr:hypothetical protein [Chryseolinea sp.]